jgi:NTE family protein
MLAEGWLSRFFDLPRRDHRLPRIGLALSCGGARGLAHIGAIQVLEEERIPISTIIGSSMGSYVGALWASGVSGSELENLAAEIKDRRTLMRLIDPVLPPTSGFIYGHKVRKHLERTLGDLTIKDLQIPTLIVATNLDTLNGEVLPPDTPVAAAVQASCAIPGICSPVYLNGARYIDGGAAQPLPVGMLRDHTSVDAIIAINVMATSADVAATLDVYPAPPLDPIGTSARLRRFVNRSLNLFAYGNVLDTFKRCLSSAQLRLLASESAAADVLIHPYLTESRWYDYENFQRYIDAGRKAAQDALPHIHSLMNLKTTETARSTSNHNHHHEPVPIISPVGHSSA